MTDIAVAGPAVLPQAAAHTLPTSAGDSTRLPPPITSTHPFDDQSSPSSSASQRSRPTTLKLSTSDVSHSLFAHDATDDLTPPSSTGSEGHDAPGSQSPSPKQDKPRSGLDAVSGDVPKSHHGSQSPPVSGMKRTASGQVKTATVADIHLATTEPQQLQTPTVLSNSAVGNVKEISQQLRTKLTYAMVKVQNGWQARSLDEVESLASASPRSTISGFPHTFDRGASALSPRTAMSAKLRKWSESDSSDSAASDARGSILSAFPARGHAGGSHRGLAPPANIIPGTRRRPTPNGNSLYAGPAGPQGQIRHAHTARPAPSQRTPSQNAAMEADAVETLLFMASPSNSGYHPPSQASQESSLRSSQAFALQTSPLRAQFSQASVTSPKKVAFTDEVASVDRTALIDQMLDDLSDESDQELEEALRLADQRAAGRISL